MDLQDALVQALKLEEDGREFYNEMVELTDDEEGKAMFRQLAADEVDHYNYIKRQVKDLEAGEGWSAIQELDEVQSLDAVSLVFPPDKELVDDLPENPNEEDALLYGLGVEDKSFKLYHNSAELANDPEAEQLFRQLAQAEATHFRILMQRYESRFSWPR
jgi:rubrerythrin